MSAIAFAGDEFGGAVAVDVGEEEGVGLREGFVDGVAGPGAVVRGAGLFEPVEAVAVTLAEDEVEFAVVVDVVAEDGEAGVAELPVRVPPPLVVVGVDLFWNQPCGVRMSGFAVAVDVGDADAVTVFLMLVAEFCGCDGLGLLLKSTQITPEWL